MNSMLDALPLKSIGRLISGTFLALVIIAATYAPAGGRGADASSPLEILLEVIDTTVSPSDGQYFLSVYLTNTLQEVAGVQMIVVADQSGLFRLPDSTRYETTIVCVDTIDCDPADTSIDTISVTPIELEGSAMEDWEFVEARALSPTTFRLAALADFPGGGTPAPIPIATTGPRLLFRMLLEREASFELLDTLSNRTVRWFITQSATGFSDPMGRTIGLQESTVCLNPPTCDSLDTVPYFDPLVNFYVDGSITFGPNCISGDVDGSGTVVASDIIFLVNYVFRAGPIPGCNGSAGDPNCSGAVNSGDIVFLVQYVFRGGAAPCTP